MSEESKSERWYRFRPVTLQQKLGYLVEECGEVQAAVGKTFRWGLDGVNPNLPKKKQETNRSWVLRELEDLERAISEVRSVLRKPAGGRSVIELPPLDPVAVYVENVAMRRLITEHIEGLPKPAADAWRDALDAALPKGWNGER